MLCPSCGTDNIEGVDSCEHCGSDLAGLDVPEARSDFRGKLLTAQLGDLSISQAVVVRPEAEVREAIERMREAQVGCALVHDGEGLVGLFDERDVLTKIIRDGRDPASTPIAEVMTPNPIQLSPHDPPAFAIHAMVEYGVRHLPLVSGSEILGYISVRNVLSFLRAHVLAGD